MLIIPYTHTKKTLRNRVFHTVRILLEGGKSPWKEGKGCRPIEDALEPNSLFVARPPHTRGDRVFAPIDETRTDMKSMYQWSELPLTDNDTLCWRTFYYVTDSAGVPWIQMPTLPSSLNELVNDIIHPKAL